MKLARRIASDAQRRAPAGLGGRYEDLVGFLVLKACEAAVSYDPTRSGGGYQFSSWLCDIMEHRVDDFYRRKSEGYGDARHGNNGRVVLVGTDDDFDVDIDFDVLLSERRMGRWHQAADLQGLAFDAWAAMTLDAAARWQLGSVA